MKNLTVARNIINQDDVDSLLEGLKERYDNIADWIGSVVRKWIIKKAPVTDAAPTTVVPGMPDWLQRSIQNGDKLVAVDLTEVHTLVEPVLDYMEDLVARKPDTDVKQIGFDVAQARATKWHEEMRKAAERRAKKGVEAPPIDEPGTEVIMRYPDGYTWRNVFSKPALNREGDVMGHCVGRFGYYNQVIRDRVQIVSLRDENNEPHVTIELRKVKDGREVHQIKGKANTRVAASYLKYVVSFLKSEIFVRVNFDGADVYHEVMNYYYAKSPSVLEAGSLRMIRKSSFARSGTEDSFAEYLILTQQKQIATITLDLENGVCDRLSVAEEHAQLAAFLAMLVTQFKLTGNPYNSGRVLEQLEPGAVWSNLREHSGYRWMTPANSFAKAISTLATGSVADELLLRGPQVMGYRQDQNFVLHETFAWPQTRVQLATDLILLTQPKAVLNVSIDTMYTRPSPAAHKEILTLAQKLLAGRNIGQSSSNKDLLQTLLAALKQPEVDELKKAAKAVAKLDDPRDADFKKFGIPCGGRSLNAIALLLTCSLVPNKAAFQEYAFDKPHALTCFTEVLTKPDHVIRGLKSYGIDEEQILNIVVMLKNEFIRLIPDVTAVDAMTELDPIVRNRVKTLVRSVATLKNNKQQSKEIWGQLP